MSAVNLNIIFYIYAIISLILTLTAIFILQKSTSIANLLFVATPLLFTTILIFNMLNYFGHIINNILLWFPYLIAPLGMMLSSLYILQGPGFHKDRKLRIFLAIYIFLAIIFSSYPNPLQFEMSYPQQGFQHFYLSIPFFLTCFFFLKISKVIPEEKTKIYLLVSGLLLVAFGSLLRSYSYIFNLQESYIGMIIIVLGSILAMLAFSGVKHQTTT